ncbi:hypothetical protein [Piscinibacter defluvii]|uniref:hypothetical protein n=1 Tax=Piscinibacter defluvii TaxID=1796922 RepID=UPI000FDD4C1D|nr:hypothetical protein [Piscinibacter defluvii]
MQEHQEAVSFQQRFARSDDIAAVLAGQFDQSVRVDASGIALGALLELLMLKRSSRRAVTVADASSRGRLLRRLLRSSQPCLSEASRGVLHMHSGHDSDAATNDFADTFRAQLVSAGVVTTAALRLSGALHELLTNVEEHAGDGVDGLGAFEILGREAWMVVADSGRGVLGGYQASQLADKPADAEQALKWAVIDHRSRTGDAARGTGFQTVIQSVRSLDGCVRVRSDDASLELEQEADRSRLLLREQGKLRGFVVSVLLRW